MTIRAEDLTAEERAIVDHFALNPLKDWAYAFKIAKPWIEQRRALFAPAQPEPKREELWLAYVELLMDEVNAHVGLAIAHGWTGSPERYARGKMLRLALGIDKETT